MVKKRHSQSSQKSWNNYFPAIPCINLLDTNHSSSQPLILQTSQNFFTLRFLKPLIQPSQNQSINQSNFSIKINFKSILNFKKLFRPLSKIYLFIDTNQLINRTHLQWKETRTSDTAKEKLLESWQDFVLVKVSTLCRTPVSVTTKSNSKQH